MTIRTPASAFALLVALLCAGGAHAQGVAWRAATPAEAGLDPAPLAAVDLWWLQPFGPAGDRA